MKRLYPVLVLIVGLTLLAGCAESQPDTPDDAQSVVRLTPYNTLTVTSTTTPTLPSAPTDTPIPTTTSTPRVYEVKENDTLIWIAYNNGLTLDELEAANPDVNAYTLSKGTKLMLPAPSGLSGTQAPPTPTPVAISLQPPVCYPSLTGGLMCYALVTNDTAGFLQNVSAEMRLIDDKNGETLIQAVFLPLQVLSPGQRLPLFASYPPPVTEGLRPAIQLLSAGATTLENALALPLEISELIFEVSADGSSAEVSGTASFTDSEVVGKMIRLVAVAYDSNGLVTGIRRYEESSQLKAGEIFKFQIKVYSPVSRIVQVEVLGEIQP